MIIATKNAIALNVVSILKNKESGHHCNHSTNHWVHWTVSIHKTHHNIQVTPKNNNAQYSI
jgi:sterol desaturase/sphingolipid hydroxylase (fatty acid hydroxylase superfamily)